MNPENDIEETKTNIKPFIAWANPRDLEIMKRLGDNGKIQFYGRSLTISDEMIDLRSIPVRIEVLDKDWLKA